MKIAIIGGGASGVLAAILIKKENIDHDVYIFEHENKLLKKLLATGNGRCNLGNAKIDINKYRNKDFVKCIFKPEPTYLGDTIPVSGDGDVTNDK